MSSDPLAAYRTLQGHYERANAEVAAIRASMDAEIARLAVEETEPGRVRGAAGTARLLGVHRNEIDRRLRRHRQTVTT